MTVYQPQELQQIIDHAAEIEAAGPPIVTRTEQDSSVIVTTTQVYRVYVLLGDDGHIIENPDTKVIALRPATGPIIITTSCNMVCTPCVPESPAISQVVRKPKTVVAARGIVATTVLRIPLVIRPGQDSALGRLLFFETGWEDYNTRLSGSKSSYAKGIPWGQTARIWCDGG